MRNKRAVNLTLQPEIIEWAKKIMAKRHYTSLSILVEELIRERYDQIFGTKDQPSLGKSSRSTSAYPPARREFSTAEDRPAPKKKTGT
jgi:hypothetical protein